MEKMKKIHFKKRVKETLAVTLSMLMVLGTVLVPVKSEAKTVTDTMISVGDVLVQGDRIKFDNNTYGAVMFDVNVPGEEATMAGQFRPVDGSSSRQYEIGSMYYYDNNPTLEYPQDSTEPKIIIVNSKRTRNDEGREVLVIDGAEYNGFKVLYHHDEEVYREDYTYYRYGTTSSDKIDQPCRAPSVEDEHDSFGEVIGWSTNSDYYDSSSRGKFVPVGGDVKYSEFISYESNSSLDLYSVYNRTSPETELSVEMDDYSLEEEIPVPTVTTDRTDYEINYYKGDDTTSLGSEVPEKPGSYTIKVTAPATDSVITNGVLTSRGFVSEEATDTFTVTGFAKVSKAPEAIEGLAYTGEAQELIHIGEVENGVLNYRIFVDGEEELDFSETVPSATEVGDYTVQYMAVGIDGYDDSDIESIDVTIDKAEISPKVSIEGWTYGQTANSPSIDASTNPGGGEVKYLYKAVNAEDSTYETRVPSESGGFTVMAIVTETDNYKGGSGTADFEIAKASPKMVTEPTAKSGLVYNGSELALLDKKGSVEHGTLVYSLEESGNYSDSVPTAKDPGDYPVWYKVLGAQHYEDISPKKVTATIAKGKPTLSTAPKANTLTENGKAQALVTAGKAEHGTILYSTAKDGTYSTAVPTATKAGDYTVWYKVNGDTNYTNIDPASVGVKIAQKQEEKKEDKKEDKKEEKKEDNKTVLKSGSVSISVSSATYGGNPPTPVVTSTTNDVSKATILYKSAAAPDNTYSAKMPSEVGNYAAKVTLPANNEYAECSATCGFSISYLPLPQGAYTIEGTQGTQGWYKSAVKLLPGDGYQISVGNRGNFTAGPIDLSEANAGGVFYVRKAETGEQTDGIKIATLRIDAQVPQIHGMEGGGLYFADENGAVIGTASDKNLDKVLVDGKEVEVKADGKGNVTFDLPTGKRKQKVEITVLDKAGNETKMSVTTAPAWMQAGIIGEGEYFLEGDGTGYKTPTGTSVWTADGDATTYMPGITFYANEGDYNFHKH